MVVVSPLLGASVFSTLECSPGVVLSVMLVVFYQAV